MHTITDEGLIANLDDLLKSRFAARHIKLGKNHTTPYASSSDHISKFKGRGMDFAEVRAYHPGDDIRHMDWRVTARTGKPHLKIYHEERQRPVYFVIDYTHSMHFGTRKTYKAVMAANVLAHLAWAALYHKDRVGGVIFSGDTHTEIKPCNNHVGMVHLLKKLTDKRYLKQTHQDDNVFIDALARVRRVALPGSLVFILSDFARMSGTLKQELINLGQGREVYNLFFYDPIEVSVPKKAAYTFSDGDTHMRINLGQSKAIKKYESLFLERMAWLEMLYKAKRISHIAFSTEDAILPTLAGSLRLRRRR